MAEQSAADRTEEPTPERLRKAREEGQIPHSQELPSAMMLGMLLVVLLLAGAGVGRWLIVQLKVFLGSLAAGPADQGFFVALMQEKGSGCLGLLVPFLLAGAAVSLLASLIGSGWAFSPKAIALKADRISPVKGLKNMFSLQSVVRLGISLVKLAVIGGIVWVYLRDRMEMCLRLVWETPAGTVAVIGRLVLGLLLRVVVALAVIALIDVLYQRWQYRRKLRMTRQEVKDERKQHELAPEVRGRIRAVQHEMARKRMLQAVPTADVVVANPTHVAVALRYEPGQMDAPVVVAKGPDLLCERIKTIAREHDVPVVERPELARTLYAAVEVGRPIPDTLFVAVAEVLAMIYRLRQGRYHNPNRTGES